MAKPSRLEQIQRFLAESPEDCFLQYALAIEYVGLEQDDQALKIFKQLLKDYPDYHPTYYHIGKLYERRGEQDAADNSYSKGIALCQRLNEQHAMRELRTALDELRYD